VGGEGGRVRERRGGERKGSNGKGTHSGLDPVSLLFLWIYAYATVAFYSMMLCIAWIVML